MQSIRREVYEDARDEYEKEKKGKKTAKARRNTNSETSEVTVHTGQLDQMLAEAGLSFYHSFFVKEKITKYFIFKLAEHADSAPNTENPNMERVIDVSSMSKSRDGKKSVNSTSEGDSASKKKKKPKKKKAAK